MRISTRGRVDPFIVMDVMENARRVEARGIDVIHMEVGQPSTPAPVRAREALAGIMAQEPLGYTVALGLPALRERLSRLYRDWYSLDVPAERIVITSGSSAGFILGFLALFDAGDRVAIGDPGYPSYRNILRALNVDPIRIESGPDTRFQPSGDHLAGLDAAGVLVASPANPTGSMLDHDAMARLIRGADARQMSFISDEIYHGIQYDQRQPVSALSVSDDVVVINSFSKYFSMTGWRIGWMVVPADLVRTMERLAQNLFICPSHASQIAALAALDAEDECQANLAVYARNRDVLLNELPGAGFSDIAPCDGAFYLYSDVAALTDDSRAFSTRMLEEAGVAATPGLDFDPVRGHQWIRFSFAGSTQDMVEGARRLKTWLRA